MQRLNSFSVSNFSLPFRDQDQERAVHLRGAALAIFNRRLAVNLVSLGSENAVGFRDANRAMLFRRQIDRRDKVPSCLADMYSRQLTFVVA